jgi:uncharacterized coiled-coil DUF342 family protein
MSKDDEPDEIKQLCEERYNIVKELKELSAERKQIEEKVHSIVLDAMTSYRMRESLNAEVKNLKEKRDALKPENKKLESLQRKYKEMEYDMNCGRISIKKERDFFKRLGRLKLEIDNEKANPTRGKIDKKEASARHKVVVEKSKEASEHHKALSAHLKTLADITDIADGNSVRRRKLGVMFENVQGKINEKYDELKGGSRPKRKVIDPAAELQSMMERLESGETLTTADLLNFQGGL